MRRGGALTGCLVGAHAPSCAFRRYPLYEDDSAAGLLHVVGQLKNMDGTAYVPAGVTESKAGDSDEGEDDEDDETDEDGDTDEDAEAEAGAFVVEGDGCGSCLMWLCVVTFNSSC